MSLSLSTIRAILYDLDGTLADSFRPIRESFNHMLKTLGQTRVLTFEESLGLVGGGLEEAVARLLSPGEVAQGTAVFRAHYESIYLDTTHPMPGAESLLREISRRGLSQGVVTNKLGTSARALIRHFGWSDLLPLCLGEHDGFPLKPSPEMILAAAKTMGLAPRNILFVGDSPFDREAARRAGCPVVLLTTGTHQEKELASLDPLAVLGSLTEMEGVLRELA
ncbi:MAG: HAD family hydrolase [Leptospirillia bacterium]